jgi:sugar phosphate isomerase/epimerase
MKLEGFLDRVAWSGFDNVGLTARAFTEMPVAEIAAALQSRGLGVSSVNSAGYFLFADTAVQARQTAENERLIASAATLGANGLNIIAGGIGDMPMTDARQRATAGLHRLAEQARTADVILLVEPVHPAAIHDKGCFSTIAQVADAIAGIVNARMTIDLFHSWWDPGLDAALSDPAARIGLVQFCDVAVDDAGFALARALPGHGKVDITRALRQTIGAHPDVPLELELFAERFTDYDFDRVLETAGSAVDRAARCQGNTT